ncbi:MAG: F-actin-capping protein subunit alpha [Vezdaea aestivalis]|nr:MAG: F-actin-capping protein subunit alpha [Vezdaea aestivalis]
MASNQADAVSKFIQGAPPGEFSEVIADIKALDPHIIREVEPAIEHYNHDQFTTTKLPGASHYVIVSAYNRLDDGRYYDIESKTSYQFDHPSQGALSPQSYVHESSHSDLVSSLLKGLRSYVDEHFPSASIGVYPQSDSKGVAIVIVANKYSPTNFWNGRWRSSYLLDTSSNALRGSIKVDVHYYEDGNVRLLTSKTIELSADASGPAVVKQIAQAERKYHEELNRGFVELSEGAFKSLRRQLPITRQKIEWDKVSSYRLGQDIGGGKNR